MAVRESFLPFSPPFIGDAEKQAVIEALDSGWLTTGPKTKAFEQAFADVVDAPEALALNSCTSGLHLALRVHDIGPGDEVITSVMTFVSTVNVIEHVGATPVLADVDASSLNLSLETVKPLVSERTRAIIAVHFAGNPVALSELRAFCDQRNIALIEDAAHALPTKVEGDMVGSGRNLAAFSFYATKNLTTGEGGMLTGAPELLARARVLSLHGLSKDAWKRYDKAGKWRYDVAEPGYKYNMTDMQAAMGLVQLEKLASMHQRRTEIAAIYNQAFSADGALQPPSDAAPGSEHAWHLYVLRLRLDQLSINRDEFIDALAAKNIGTSVHFIPVYEHSYYREKYALSSDQFAVTAEQFPRMLSLPLHPGLSDGDVDDVIEAVLETVKENG